MALKARSPADGLVDGPGRTPFRADFFVAVYAEVASGLGEAEFGARAFRMEVDTAFVAGKAVPVGEGGMDNGAFPGVPVTGTGAAVRSGGLRRGETGTEKSGYDNCRFHAHPSMKALTHGAVKDSAILHAAPEQGSRHRL
jgi:hypothetical protein